ncbi:putative quinol monooxygenase [Tessaracoccus sp. Z1128]
MIFIVVKYQVKPESAEQWMDVVGPFNEATRAEPGNLWFEWSRSMENPNEYVLVEAFRDGDAGSAHVNSAHFPRGLDAMRPHILATPQIISRTIDGDGWDTMGELRID